MLTRPARLLAGLAALLAVAAGLTVGATPASASTAFQVASVVDLGASASDVVLADLDGDGDLDQAVNLPATSQVGVLRNSGTGQFSAPVRYPAVGADYLAAGDLDGNGLADVVVADTDENSVSVLLAAGSGGLLPPATTPAGVAPRDVALADFDGDGDLDVVVANRSAAAVTVLLGDGAGGLSAALTSPAGDVYGPLGVGDVDGDGPTDLVVSDLGGGRLQFLRGLGDGRFATPLTALTVPFPAGVLLGDLDADGTLDAVVNQTASEATPTQIRVALGTGSGTFAAPRTYAVASFYDRQTELALADVDADGRLDLLVSSDGSDGVSLLYGVGGGALSTDVEIADVEGPAGLAVGDVDDDGDPDLVTASTLTRVYVNSGVSPLAFRFTNPRTFPTHGGPNAIRLGDVDDDGDLDAVTVSRTADSVSVMIGDGAGGLTRRVFLPASGDPADLALGDLDGDGDLDIVVANQLDRAVTTWLGIGRGGFTSGATLSLRGMPTRLALGDLDGDGVLDLAVSSSNTAAGGVGVALGRGDGSFSPRPAIAPEGGHPLVIADLDGDADLDLAFGVRNNRIQVSYGDGRGRFTTPVDVSTGLLAVSDVAAADVTYDGRVDLITDRAVLPGQASGFGRAVMSSSAQGRFQLADIDADGRLDKVVSELGRDGIAVHPGAGAGLFLPPTRFPVGASGPGALAVGDLDGDGTPDVAAISAGYNTVSTLLNESVPTPPDLAVTQLTVSVPAVAPGGSLQVRDYTSNVGDAAAGASTTRYRLSLDDSLSNSVPLVGARTVPPLAAGRTNNGTATVTLPASLAPGTYRLLACADDLGAVPENDELNNCVGSLGLVVEPAGVDLEQQVTVFAGTAVLAGQTLTTGDWVRNDGPAAAGPFAVSYLLSSNRTVGPEDILLTGGRTVPGLAAQTVSKSGDVVVGVPAGTPGGTYNLYSCADYERVVPESDETNNCERAAATVEVTGLYVDLFTNRYGPLPTEVAAGSSFQVEFSTTNAGTLAAPASTTAAFLNVFFQPGDTDPQVGTRAVPPLAPNQTVTRTITVTVPIDTAPGRYGLGVCSDVSNLIPESAEENCLYTTDFQVSG